MDEYIYQLHNVSFSYLLNSQETLALKNISLNIHSQSLTTLSGPSGSGKSTLLNILGLIEPIQKGEIVFQGNDLKKLSEAEKNKIRKYKIGFIFQFFHLIPVLTAEENVSYFLERQHLDKNEIQCRIEDTLSSVGLWEHRTKKPNELSGGQKQRLAIARAIAKQPDVIIGDEPTASLDQKNGHEIMSIFQKLIEKKKIGIILTTHDSMVQSYANYNYHLQDGLLV